MNRQDKKKSVVVFIHIPKTAGTTLSDVLKHQYRKKNTLIIHGNIEEKEAEFKEKYYADRNQIYLIKGHMTFGVHQFLDCHCKYITFVRNPIDRILSVYYYLSKNQRHPQYHLVKGKTLEEFVSSNTAHHNGQTRFIAGRYDPRERWQPANLLDRAKKNLQENFVIVGLTERFDETLIVLKRKLEWSNMPFYVKQNKSNKPATETIAKSTLTLIKNRNSLDVELYRYAKEIFETQLNRQNDCFEDELRKFSWLNKIYQPMGNTYSMSRFFVLKIKKSIMQIG